MTKEKTPQHQPEGQDPTDNSLVEVSPIEFADSLLEEWRPFLQTEGERLLAREVSYNRAAAHLAQKGLQEVGTSCGEVLSVIAAQKQENIDLRRGYDELCKTYDEIKSLIHELTVRQGQHISNCDKNFRDLEQFLKRFGA